MAVIYILITRSVPQRNIAFNRNHNLRIESLAFQNSPLNGTHSSSDINFLTSLYYFRNCLKKISFVFYVFINNSNFLKSPIFMQKIKFLSKVELFQTSLFNQKQKCLIAFTENCQTWHFFGTRLV